MCLLLSGSDVCNARGLCGVGFWFIVHGHRKLCHDLHTVSLLAELHAEHRRSQAKCEGRDVQAPDLSAGFGDCDGGALGAFFE